MRSIKDGMEIIYYADDGTELANVTPERVSKSGKWEKAVLALNGDLFDNKTKKPYSERVLPKYKEDVEWLLKAYATAIITEYLTPNVPL